MEIKILHLVEGARKATGLTVIIDVFRAFTVEAFLAQNHAGKIIPVSSLENAVAYRQSHPEALLCGERKGVMVEGFQYGNSPSQIENVDFTGKTVVHTTSAGTQGIANAIHAEEILGGSLVNARAIAAYIRQKNPEQVSLVCMGLDGKERTDEDTFCAKYIMSLLQNNPMRNVKHHIAKLKHTDGAKFFDPAQQAVFPERDFLLSTQCDRFDFVLRLKADTQTELGYMERVDVTYTEETVQPTCVKPGDMLSQFSPEQINAFPKEVKASVSYGKFRPAEGNFDAALILGGNPDVLESRAAAAAKLYHQGRCSLFIPTGGVPWETEFGYLSECETLYRYMVSMGVPEENILIEANATTTHENMQCSRELLSQRMPLSGARLAVVTSAYHTRRSVQISRFYIPEAQHFEVRAEAPNDDPLNFHKDPRLVTAVTTECRLLCKDIQKGICKDFPCIE